MYKALDVLAKQVKIKGIFSDWPGHGYVLCELHGPEVSRPGGTGQ